MKRRPEQILREAFSTAISDLKKIWPAVAAFGGYFLVGRKFLYSLCPSVVFTGFPCPGCGLTRATVSILKGRFADAWYLNPFSYAILLFVFVFGVRRYLMQKETKSLLKWMIVIGAGMVIFYIYRMIRYFPNRPPMTYYYGSAGYRMWVFIRNVILRR